MVVFAVLLLAPISWISVWMTFCTGVTLQCATLMKRRWRTCRAIVTGKLGFALYRPFVTERYNACEH